MEAQLGSRAALFHLARWELEPDEDAAASAGDDIQHADAAFLRMRNRHRQMLAADARRRRN